MFLQVVYGFLEGHDADHELKVAHKFHINQNQDNDHTKYIK